MIKDTIKVRIKGREIPITQLLAYDELKLTGKPLNEKIAVLTAINEYGPQTSRSLSKRLRKERGNITRTLKNLENEGIIFVCKIDRCPVTERRVQFYDILLDRPQQPITLFD